MSYIQPHNPTITDKNEQYSGIAVSLIDFFSSKGIEITDNLIKHLQENKDELIKKFGGKSYNILLLIELSKENGFKVPHTEFISTDLHKKIYSNHVESNPNIISAQGYDDHEEINFSAESKDYLKEVFSKFGDTKYISIRSSANVEDGGKNNYPGVFYTGFCSTTDFNKFLEEVKKVLKSSNGKEAKQYQKAKGITEEIFMGINIMEVVGKSIKNNNIQYFKPDFSGAIYPITYEVFANEYIEGLNIGITSGEKRNSYRKIYFTNVKTKEILTDSAIKYTSNNLNYRHVLSTEGNPDVISSDEEYIQPGTEIIDNIRDIYAKLMSHYGFPIEIEYTIQKDEIYLLQIKKSIHSYIQPEDFPKKKETNGTNKIPPYIDMRIAGFIDEKNLNIITYKKLRTIGTNKKKIVLLETSDDCDGFINNYNTEDNIACVICCVQNLGLHTLTKLEEFSIPFIELAPEPHFENLKKLEGDKKYSLFLNEQEKSYLLQEDLS